jgi:putative tryptophan/tyrosine transport system substrate-binding protein
MKRRAFIAGLTGAAALPLTARAQPAVPVIGFLNTATPEIFADRLRAFRQGLKEGGYVEGENVAIVSRFADNQFDRLPELAAELVRRNVTVICATGGSYSALAAKAATATIPIVFVIPDDPVKLELAKSLAKPGGNATGVNFFATEVGGKRLELLHELVPGATRVAVFVNPLNAARVEALRSDMDAAARGIGVQIQIFNVGTAAEIDAAFTALARDPPSALFITPDPLFYARRVQLAIMAARLGIPTAFSVREHAEVGGLMSYGSDINDAYRQGALYTSRVLKGAKPADMPIIQASKFELVINSQTARMLGITVPLSLISRADEVIE